MQLAPRRLSFTIKAEHSGQQVGVLLRKVLHLSGGAIRRAKRVPLGITLDLKLAYTNAVVSEGQVLSVQVGDLPGERHMEPNSGPLSLRYEDEDLLVVEKGAPLAVHPTLGHPDHTLSNYLLHYYQKIGLVADIHLVNRLDSGTSGLMVVAKHAHAHERLRQGLPKGTFVRNYLAACEGAPAQNEGSICLPIGRVPDSIMKREVRGDGAPACTHFRRLHSGKGHSLLALSLESGRTHQIRVHMAHIGHPLVGDFLYGSEHPGLVGRLALHSFFLSFSHPITEKKLCFFSSPPPELLSLVFDQIPRSLDLESFVMDRGFHAPSFTTGQNNTLREPAETMLYDNATSHIGGSL